MGEHSEGFVPDRRGQATECDPGSDLGAVDGRQGLPRRDGLYARAHATGHRRVTGKLPMAATPPSSMQIRTHPWGRSIERSQSPGPPGVGGLTKPRAG